MSATKRMIDFALAIADELSINEPDFDDFDEVSDFISENKDSYYESIDT